MRANARADALAGQVEHLKELLVSATSFLRRDGKDYEGRGCICGLRDLWKEIDAALATLPLFAEKESRP